MVQIIKPAFTSESELLQLSIQDAVNASKQKDMLATVDALNAALELDPKRADLWQYLGVAYAWLNVWSACITSLEIALALEPHRQRARCVMAGSLYHLGKYE